MGTISSDAPARMAALDAEGFRRQTVTVNGSISSQGAGIFLANGGKVVIGPRGSIRSTSGIAILATGTVPAVANDPNTRKTQTMAAIPPKLRVDLNLGGRRMSQAIGDDWILNDGGETTIAMNGVVLHDGATGATEETARNGAYNVRMVVNGVKVTDRSDPEMWTVSERAEGEVDDADRVIADRDFSAVDFTEVRRPSPPTPPTPPEPDPPAIDAAKLEEVVEGAVATALGSIAPAPSAAEAPASAFVEEYAPRAAVYEALPSALLGLNEAGLGTGAPAPAGQLLLRAHPRGERRLQPCRLHRRAAPWLWLSPVCSPVGPWPWGETLGASLALHRAWSTAGVEAGSGGGGIGVEATGLVLDGAWRDPDGFYAKAGLAMTRYEIDAGSDDPAVGALVRGVGARGSLVRFEAGREVALEDGLEVAPRLWLKRSALSMEDFVDAVGSRVSVADLERLTGGIGMAARTERRMGAGMLFLEGSVDLAHVLDGATTVADVSGARLTSRAPATELRAALSGVWRHDGVSLAAEASMNGSHTGDAGGALGVRLSVQF